MAEINEIVSKQAIDGLVITDKGITKLDESTKEFINTVEQLSTVLKKGGVSFKEVQTAQAKVKKTAKELTQLEQDQLVAEKALESQRKAGIRASAKYNDALKKEVKTEQDLINRTNALVYKRKQLDTTTKKGQQEWKRLTAQIKDNTEKLKRNDAQIGRFQRNVGNYSKALKGFAMNVAGALGLTAGIAGITALGKKIIGVRSEFEKFEAVLSTALGSNSEAVQTMELIKQFAAETPFSVQELTAAFVKLVNQGFKPSKDELKLLGDLAASTGKTFDQLTEAIIDAQVGEFERLKEFGIRAQKQGDQVTFTFKGVKEQVDFTTESIQAYILSLGALEGVSGSMIGISETLGGKISNLGDAWDNLLNAMGEQTSGVFKNAIEGLSNTISTMTAMLSAAQFQSEAGIDRGTFLERLFGGKTVETEALRLQKIIGDLVGASNEKIDAAIADAAGRIGYYSGEVGAEMNKLYAHFIGVLQQQQLTEIKNAGDAAEKTKELRIQAAIETAEAQEAILKEGIDIEEKRWLKLLAKIKKEKIEIEIDEDVDFPDVPSEKPEDYEPPSPEERIEAAQATFMALDAISDAYYQNEFARISQLESMLASQKAAELDGAKGNAEKIAEINRRYAKKEAALKTERAKKEKEAAIFNGLINIAQGITAALGQGPIGIVLGAIVAALGAIQIANIASTPIPKFFKGTENAPAGALIAGDRGRELVNPKHGKPFMVNEPTVLSGLQGAKIFTNQETERLMAGQMGYDSPDMRAVVESNNRIEKAIKNQKRISIDSANRTITERSGNYAKKYINAKLTGF